MASYITVAHDEQIEYIIEKSRFIATVHHCESEEEAQSWIRAQKKLYWDARHNCSAYAIGPKQEFQRSSDDGEPSGTAGKPILEIIKKKEITNIALVVTRYFGGIKLGAGGLIRAYAHSAKEVLDAADLIEYAERHPLKVTFPYTYFGAVEKWLKDQGYTYESAFTEAIEVTILTAEAQRQAVGSAVTDLCSGECKLEELAPQIVTLPYCLKNE